MSMRFVFRADASLSTGAGHVMRSFAIAEEAIARGIPSIFVGRIVELPWVTERIQSLGFKAIFDVADEFESDPAQDILILDSYDLPLMDPFIQTERWHGVVLIFDEVTPHYNCKLRIHPGLTISWNSNTPTRTLSGPQYVPIRRSISKMERTLQHDHPEIVVVGGGSDPSEFVLAISKVLSMSDDDFHANVFGKNLDSLTLDHRFDINPIGKNLDSIANRADLVFTTASTSCLEFLARGITVAIGCAVKNQEQNYRELTVGNFAVPIGNFVNNSWDLDTDAILQVLSSKLTEVKTSSKSNRLVDFGGAKRIVDEILKV
jgi:spore coat polysaccharide biosynthesis predicted glycosyltransferase SpsG